MTDLQTLLDSGESDAFEQWLLRSAAQECPTPESVAAMRAGLGLSATWAPRIAGLWSLKVTLLALAFGSLLGVHSAHAPPGTQLAAASTQPSALAGHGAAGRGQPDATVPLAGLPPAVSVEGRVNGVPADAVTTEKPRAHVERARPVVGPDLREEIKLLDATRDAIKAHQSKLALALLGQYDARFPAGAFKQEAAFLRIRTLAANGAVAAANSMAKDFVKRNPDSPYANRAARITDNAGGAAP